MSGHAGAGDTIFALASGAGRAAVAVLRVSGSSTKAVTEALCGQLPPPRRASLRRLRDARGTLLDHAMVLWMPAPGSYTGEDSAELQIHGGRAVLAAVTDALLMVGARPAEPGEFTRRAFVNGRMDLLEAEGVADLIAAETEGQRRAALRQVEGAHSAMVAGWMSCLREALAFQEALIDFPDDDLPVGVERQLMDRIDALADEVGAGISDAARGTRLRDGLVFAMTGAPNVGKSSLVNAMAGRDVAIVSESAGTTRDVLEVRLDLDGIPVTLVDTAGLRESEDPLEQEGVRRARLRAGASDLVLCVTTPDTSLAPASGVLAITNKIDVGPAWPGSIGVSARTGAGLTLLRARLADEAVRLTASGDTPVLSRARHVAALREMAAALVEARAAVLPELRAEALRLAMRALSRITGIVDTEALLDTIFGQFCIGK